ALNVIVTLLAAFTAGQISAVEEEPEFLQPLENHTVTQGRDVFFTCVVNHLGSYKVAWIKFRLESDPGNTHAHGGAQPTAVRDTQRTQHVETSRDQCADE
ncbi:hypothetical protein L9F63_026260, partial [Diploptera punctata]